jgi:hypothetical protein
LPRQQVISIFDLARRASQPSATASGHDQCSQETASVSVFRSLEAFDELLLVKVGGIVDLELSVHGGHLGLDSVFVLGVKESDWALGASVRGVHNEEEFGLGTTILGLELKVEDSVSWPVSGHFSLEIGESGRALSGRLNGGSGAIVADSDDDKSVGALHAEAVEGFSNGVIKNKGGLHSGWCLKL